MSRKPDVNTVKACILGHAVGDALGVPVEFCSRKELNENPVTSMRGFGTYPYPAGSWSDDTSMTLCALESLAKGRLDLDDVMLNFGKWYHNNDFTPTGVMFDIGNTCRCAIDAYFANRKQEQTGESSNGNGSLMRIHPFALYLSDKDMAITDKFDIIRSASALTHPHECSKLGCCIYACILWELMKTPEKSSIYSGLEKVSDFFSSSKELHVYSRIFTDGFSSLTSDEIKSSGYVADTLEAALWCLLTTASYRECVLKAVNLGDDTDTVAAVAGGLAGVLYGFDSIPTEWLDTLIKHDYIENICIRAFTAWERKDI